eukprot:1973566-Lingulodinium_polyedra.AAC.1
MSWLCELGIRIKAFYKPVNEEANYVSRAYKGLEEDSLSTAAAEAGIAAKTFRCCARRAKESHPKAPDF